MLQIVTAIKIVKMIVDGTYVLTWFELHNTVAPPARTVNWSLIEAGRISRIRVTFDPRAIVAS